MRTLRRRNQQTTALAFSHTGHRLAVGGRIGRKDGRVDVWEPSGDKPITLPSLATPPWGFAFTPDNKLAVTLPEQLTLFGGPRFQTTEVVRVWGRDYTRAAFSPDGRRVVLDVDSGLQLIDLQPPFGEVWSRPGTGKRVTPGKAAFSPDGSWLAVKAEHSVEIRDTATGKPLALFDKPPTGRWSGFNLLWSPDGRWVCEVWQQWLTVWDANTGKPVFQRIAKFGEFIDDAAFNPTAGRLAVAISNRNTRDGVVRVYSVADWSEESPYSWPVGRVEVVAFSPDGTLGAAGGDAPEVVLWDVDW